MLVVVVSAATKPVARCPLLVARPVRMELADFLNWDEHSPA